MSSLSIDLIVKIAEFMPRYFYEPPINKEFTKKRYEYLMRICNGNIPRIRKYKHIAEPICDNHPLFAPRRLHGPNSMHIPIPWKLDSYKNVQDMIEFVKQIDGYITIQGIGRTMIKSLILKIMDDNAINYIYVSRRTSRLMNFGIRYSRVYEGDNLGFLQSDNSIWNNCPIYKFISDESDRLDINCLDIKDMQFLQEFGKMYNYQPFLKLIDHTQNQ